MFFKKFGWKEANENFDMAYFICTWWVKAFLKEHLVFSKNKRNTNKFPHFCNLNLRVSSKSYLKSSTSYQILLQGISSQTVKSSGEGIDYDFC